MWRQPSVRSHFQKLNFGNSSPKAPKSKYQTFLDLSSFTGFLYLVPNILSKIVDDSRNTNLSDSSFKTIYCFKRCKCYLNCNMISKNTIINLKYDLKQLWKTSNYIFLSDDTPLYYRNAIDMLLLTVKLNLKCYVLYETKELLILTTTKIYNTIINILIFIVNIVIVIIIISIIIIVTINVIIISVTTVFVKSAWQIG